MPREAWGLRAMSFQARTQVVGVDGQFRLRLCPRPAWNSRWATCRCQIRSRHVRGAPGPATTPRPGHRRRPARGRRITTSHRADRLVGGRICSRPAYIRRRDQRHLCRRLWSGMRPPVPCRQSRDTFACVRDRLPGHRRTFLCQKPFCAGTASTRTASPGRSRSPVACQHSLPRIALIRCRAVADDRHCRTAVLQDRAVAENNRAAPADRVACGRSTGARSNPSLQSSRSLDWEFRFEGGEEAAAVQKRGARFGGAAGQDRPEMTRALVSGQPYAVGALHRAWATSQQMDHPEWIMRFE